VSFWRRSLAVLVSAIGRAGVDLIFFFGAGYFDVRRGGGVLIYLVVTFGLYGAIGAARGMASKGRDSALSMIRVEA